MMSLRKGRRDVQTPLVGDSVDVTAQANDKHSTYIDYSDKHNTADPMYKSDTNAASSGGLVSWWVSLKDDRWNVLLLVFLYVLQGIPLGLAGSMPMIIQNKKADYAAQAFFSLVFWPFSLKLFWAPFVDSVYLTSFGRRKSWLVPVQYTIAAAMFVLAYFSEYLLNSETGEVRIVAITGVFFCLTFLAATQDIAVDGWALTMLSKENVGLASTCNSVGQTAGYFLANVLFLSLESKEFCNSYLRSTPADTGLVTLSGFLIFWACVFLLSTTLVMLFKTERVEEEEQPEGIIHTYQVLYNIIRLPAVLRHVGILLVYKIGFCAADSVAGLKLIEAGVSKDKLALLGVPMVPIQILLPIFISKYTAGPKPLSVLLKAYPFRLLMGLVFTWIVYITPSLKSGEHDFPYSYYALLLASYALHQVALYCMFVAIMAFHARISDPSIGGTYMTLLNTVANLGGNWCSTLALYMVERLTTKSCSQAADGTEVCETIVDGFYIEMAVCTVVGILLFPILRRKMNENQNLDPSQWTCKF